MSKKRKNMSGLSVPTGDLEKALLDKNPHLFEGLSDEKKSEMINAVREFLSVEVSEITWERKAPLPTPPELKGYYEIKKEYADTIVSMASEHQKYFHLRDDKVINKSFQAKARGQNYALTIAIIAISGVLCVFYLVTKFQEPS